LPEDRLEVESQKIAQNFAIRRLSVLVGLGAFFVNTEQSLLTDEVKIPQINLNSTIIGSETRVVKPDFKDDINITNWSDFHNGVSMGLQITKEAFESANKENLRTWIDYQRSDTPKFEDAGLILALGLQGVLDCFVSTDIYCYLKDNVESRSIAVLLGLAASRIGMKDECTMKSFAIHLNVFLPDSPELDIHQTVQSASLLAIGLQYLGTCKKQYTDLMVSQIGAKPTRERNYERECYSLAAGFALGLINLRKGSSNAMKCCDHDLDEKLLKYIEGGSVTGNEWLFRGNLNQNENKCSNIKEGKFINTQLTAQPALIALGLIHMKTNNRELADRIIIPKTLYEIENCNPNHI
jgi:anaphase-promoting complex subunit 1